MTNKIDLHGVKHQEVQRVLKKVRLKLQDLRKTRLIIRTL